MSDQQKPETGHTITARLSSLGVPKIVKVNRWLTLIALIIFIVLGSLAIFAVVQAVMAWDDLQQQLGQGECLGELDC